MSPSTRRSSAQSQTRRRSSSRSTRGSLGLGLGLQDDLSNFLNDFQPIGNDDLFAGDFGAYDAPQELSNQFTGDATDGFELTQFDNVNTAELNPQAQQTEQPLGEFDFDPNDPVLQADVWNMLKHPRASLPGSQQNSYPDPQYVQQQQPYYNPQLQAPYQQADYQPQQYQQGFENFGDMTLTGALNAQDAMQPYMDPALFNPGVDASGPLFMDEGAENISRTRSRSVSSGGSVARVTRSNTRSANNSSNNSSYTDRSRRSTSTDDSERKVLKVTRKVMQRGSAYRGAFKPEKPKLCDAKPWVRTNATTQGLTTRTAKINHYQPVYEERPHPIGTSWVSPLGNTFEYTDKFEFKQKTFTAEQIRDFIFHYPKDKRTHARLKLWIQKTPTDSARRYHSVSHAKCRFQQCPAHIYQTGTILHGHYRIAFDERWHAHGLNVDPFHMAGFVHLYCMERFLDFEAVCRLGIVEVDDRAMPHEPKGRFAGTLAGQPEYHIASQFVGEAKNGTLRQNVEEFKNYPVHSQFKRGAEKPHKDTLTYWMHMYKQETRPKAQIKQFEERGLKASHIIVNKGNLEVLFRDCQKRKRVAKAEKARKKRKVADGDADDEHDQEDQELVHEALEEAKQKIEKGSKPKKRKRIFIEVTDDEESSGDEPDYGNSDSEDDAHPQRSPKKGFRKSPRLKDKQRKSYRGMISPSPVAPELPEYRYPEVTEQQMQQPQQTDDLYAGYAPANQGTQDSESFQLPTFEYDINDPDFAGIAHLLRRPSSVSYRRSSRGPSVIGPISSNARSSTDRRVSFGGVTTHPFDTTAAPNRGAGRRRSTRSRNGQGDKSLDGVLKR